MPWWAWGLAIGLGCALAAFVLYRAIGTGVIWDGIVRAATRGAKAIFYAMLPGILKALKPASTEELARRKTIRDRGGEDAPSGRPFGRQKGE